MSLNVVVAEVPTCRKLLQVAPVQRSIKYWVMVPPVSVAAVQERLICTGPAAAAVRFDGAVNEGAPVMAEGAVDYGMNLFPAAVGRARWQQVVEASMPVRSSV